MTDNTPETAITTKHWALRWAETQGAATVLLFLIAWGVWRAAPTVLEKIEGLIDRQNAALKESRQEFRAELQAERADHKQSEEANRKAFDESIDTLTDALQARGN